MRENSFNETQTSRCRKALLLKLLAFALVTSVLVPSKTFASKDAYREISNEIDALFPQLQKPVSPGAAVMVIRDGKPIFTRCYGFSNLESRNPVSPSTPFRLASVSKQFTATAILLLEEKGILSIDDYASETVPEIKRIGEKITIRHLLNHTSGLPNYYPVLYKHFEKREPTENDSLFGNAQAISFFEDWGELEFQPGERYKYSNSGYEALGLIIERASGLSFARFLEENIFKPLEMDDAFVRDRPELKRVDRAIGYRMDDQSEWTMKDDDPLNWILGAGGIYASLNDLYKWDQALNTDRLLSQKIFRTAFRDVVLNDGTSHPYGFGWNLSDRIGQKAVWHSGKWLGFSNMFARYPDHHLSIIMLSSASIKEHRQLGDEISKLFLRDDQR